MDKAKFGVAILVGKYLANNLTDEEQKYLSDWLSSSEKNRTWFERVTSESYQIEKGKATRSINVEEGWKALELKRESRLGDVTVGFIGCVTWRCLSYLWLLPFYYTKCIIPVKIRWKWCKQLLPERVRQFLY